MISARPHEYCKIATSQFQILASVPILTISAWNWQ
jgi:hypothetical protein